MYLDFDRSLCCSFARMIWTLNIQISWHGIIKIGYRFKISIFVKINKTWWTFVIKQFIFCDRCECLVVNYLNTIELLNKNNKKNCCKLSFKEHMNSRSLLINNFFSVLETKLDNKLYSKTYLPAYLVYINPYRPGSNWNH